MAMVFVLFISEAKANASRTSVRMGFQIPSRPGRHRGGVASSLLLWARSVESRMAVLLTAGPGALPGGSISISFFKRGEVEAVKTGSPGPAACGSP